MLKLDDLRTALCNIFFKGDEKNLPCIVPLQGNWFVPNIDQSKENITWIGYTILDLITDGRGKMSDEFVVKNTQGHFRLTFIGPKAEEWANSTIFWDDRSDVKDEFEKMNASLNYVKRRIYTRVFSQEGMNDTLVWVVDIKCQGFAYTEHNLHGWLPLN